MKQIKTIIEPIYDASEYDKKVNRLLQNGWTLTKRNTISVKGEPNEVGSSEVVQMLYAEFEKDNYYFEEVTL